MKNSSTTVPTVPVITPTTENDDDPLAIIESDSEELLIDSAGRCFHRASFNAEPRLVSLGDSVRAFAGIMERSDGWTTEDDGMLRWTKALAAALD
jgi:hypothetical protein